MQFNFLQLRDASRNFETKKEEADKLRADLEEAEKERDEAIEQVVQFKIIVFTSYSHFSV